MIKIWVNGKLLPEQKIEFDAEKKVVTIKWTKWELLWQRLRLKVGRPVHVVAMYECATDNNPRRTDAQDL